MQMTGIFWPRNPGEKNTLQFFYRGVGNTFLEVIWSGTVVKKIEGPRAWGLEEVEVSFVGENEDRLSFRGGRSPGISYIDDIYLFRTT